MFENTIQLYVALTDVIEIFDDTSPGRIFCVIKILDNKSCDQFVLGDVLVPTVLLYRTVWI